jgi:hypothetical protein
LDFANTKTLDPRITFTRASGGSYVGADGLIKYAGVNEARFDHDPETGESLGLLIEEARTNNAVSSQDFTTLWSPSGSASVISNVILSPSGNLDGTKLVEPTVNQENYIRNAARTLSAGTYTASIYVHESSERRLWLRPVHIGSTHATSSVVFNPKTKTLGSPTGFGISASATNAGGGWWRVSLTFTTPDTRNIQHGVNAITASAVYTGDGTSGIFIWGAQLEEGAFPTSYIPTQASTRTRAAESAQITGKNFSDFYRQDEGTVATSISHFHLAAPPSDYNNRQAILFRKDANNNIQIRHANGIYNTNVYYGIISDGNLSRARIGDNLPWTPYTLYNISFNYNVNKNISYTLNGLNPQTGMVVQGRDLLIPTGDNAPNELLILQGSNGPFNGWIRNLKYYPKALTPSQLQALTR